MRQDYLSGDKENLSNTEKEIEKALRPLTFDDFAGQDKILENLKIFVQAARQRGDALPRVVAWPSGIRENHPVKYCSQ